MKQDGRRGKTRCTLLEKNCVLFYLIIVLREWNQAQLELFSKILSFQSDVGCIPRQSVYGMQRKI